MIHLFDLRLFGGLIAWVLDYLRGMLTCDLIVFAAWCFACDGSWFIDLWTLDFICGCYCVWVFVDLVG